MDLKTGSIVFYRGKPYRWCAKHKVLHGRLYVCDEYSEAVKKDIQIADNKMKATFGVALALLLIFVSLLTAYGMP